MTIQEALDPAVLDVDPYTVGNLRNPFPMYDQLRSAGPLVELSHYGWLSCARDQEVREILTDHRTWISGAGVGPKNLLKEGNWRSPGVLESDGARHTQLRGALDEVISPRTVRGMRSGFASVAEPLIERLVAQGTFDAATDLAEDFPLVAFGDLIGIPASGRREMLLPHGQMHFSTFGPANELHEEFWRRGEGTHEWVVERCARENLVPGGLGARVWELTDNGVISDEYAGILVRSLLSAGLDTTVLSIGLILNALLRHPDALRRVIDDPGLVPFAIDEALRWDSPFQTFFRTSAHETSIGGHVVPADTKVLLFIGGANRDPERWGDDSESFDIDRNASGHLAFGRGLHQCVGQPITRLEATVALQALFSSIESMELIGEPEPFVHNSLRGWTSLPVKVVPRRQGSGGVATTTAVTPRADQVPSSRPVRAVQTLTVSATAKPAPDVLELTLVDTKGSLMQWSPGAHLDVHLTDDAGTELIRQYSLCGDPAENTYRIAVRLDEDGRGGSRSAHRLRAGDEVTVSVPRNNFPLSLGGQPLVFIAGGIGITPLLPMLAAAEKAGTPMRVLFTGKEVKSMPYVDRVRTMRGATVHESARSGRVDVRAWVSDAIRELGGPVDVYACGPSALNDAVKALDDLDQVRSVAVELFRHEVTHRASDTAFDLELRSGQIVRVGADETILEALDRAGGRALSSCQEGVCGTCETVILEGEADHRDHILEDHERPVRMMPCVSRALGARIKLDL